MKKVSSFLFLLFLFLLPFNIKFAAYVSPYSSLASDFNIFFLYPVEFLLLCSFLSSGSFKSPLHFPRWEGLLLLLLLPSYFLAVDISLSFLASIRILEFLMILSLLRRQVVQPATLFMALALSLSCQAVISILQYWQQSSVGLQLMGESLFHTASVNTAKITILGEKIVRSYGTFPHPNILGYFMSIAILGLLLVRETATNKLLTWTRHFMLLLLLIGLFLTFSRSALLSLVLGLIMFFLLQKRKRVILPTLIATVLTLIVLTILFPASLARYGNADMVENISRLTEYKEILPRLAQFPFGVGLGNASLIQEQLDLTTAAQWQITPVHNTILLLSHEGGIGVGLLLLVLFIVLSIHMLRSSPNTWFILPLALVLPLLTDHFVWTSFQALMLTALILGVCLQHVKNRSAILPNASAYPGSD